jgi:hypothetical protein
LLGIALTGRERPQIARFLAGDLLSEVCVASLPAYWEVNVKDSLKRFIDDFREFQLLNAVADSLAVVVAGR